MSRAGNEKMSGTELVIKVAASAVITEGTMVAINASGYAVTASKKANERVAGCAMRYVDNTNGDDGAEVVHVRRGVFVWNNDGSIKETDVLKDCYVANENTVTITADGSSRAGKILAVESDGVTVEML